MPPPRVRRADVSRRRHGPTGSTSPTVRSLHSTRGRLIGPAPRAAPGAATLGMKTVCHRQEYGSADRPRRNLVAHWQTGARETDSLERNTRAGWTVGLKDHCVARHQGWRGRRRPHCSSTSFFSNQKKEVGRKKGWCGWSDSNRHGLRHYPLKIACLPVPPHPQLSERACNAPRGRLPRSTTRF